MKVQQKLIIAIPVLLAIAAAWIAWRLTSSQVRLRDAVAGVDTGTLLVEYMKTHDNRWPSSWEDLLSILHGDAGRQIPFRGADDGDTPYAGTLHNLVAVNWSFDPRHPADQPDPITRADGAPLPDLGENPNQMIRRYLTEHPSTQPAERR